MLSDAFFSIVSKDCARDELLVRARRKGDIEKVFPGVKVARNQQSDYLFRAVVKRAALAEAMEGELRRITYNNFKDSVADRSLHDAYLRVWTEMAKLQNPRPFSIAGLPDYDPSPPFELQIGVGHANVAKKKRRNRK